MIKTNTKYNFDRAENDVFSWTQWDGSSGNILTHKATGREIYQMSWCTKGKMVEPVTDDTREQALAFWDELFALQNQEPEDSDEGPEPEPEHGVNGYCRKCHSYCFGDCEAN